MTTLGNHVAGLSTRDNNAVNELAVWSDVDELKLNPGCFHRETSSGPLIEMDLRLLESSLFCREMVGESKF